MKIYLVGGAVRDQIMGVSSRDRDYVVVGSSIDEMLSRGYILVGKSFPVFIKPDSSDEYALARKEKKIGDKHTDFELIFDSSITLEEDLMRRDFTCNAIAYDEELGRYIDYTGGIQDIQNKVLRHINSHFVEDPLRIIRLCRFAAQLNFSIAPETMVLCREMSKSGQLKHLSSERIWNEIRYALKTTRFCKFIETAHECGALKTILPLVEDLWHRTKNSSPLIDYTLKDLKKIEAGNDVVKFAFLLKDTAVYSDLDKSYLRNIKCVQHICSKLKVQNTYRRFVIFIYKNIDLLENISIINLRDILSLIDSYIKTDLDFENFLTACRGLGSDKSDFKETECKLRKIQKILSKIKAEDIPNFHILPKDFSFKYKFFEFKLMVLEKSLININYLH